MKQVFFALLLAAISLALLGVLWIKPATTIQASGITSEPNRAGEVRVINQDGVIYLSTETNADPAATRSSASAAPTERQRYQISNPLSSLIEVPVGFAENIQELISFVSRLVLAIAALLVFGYLIWGAFDWITSGGDRGKIDKARQKIISAVIGLLIISASYAILNLALGFLGFGSLEGALNNVGTIQQGPSPTPATNLGDLIEATPSATPE